MSSKWVVTLSFFIVTQYALMVGFIKFIDDYTDWDMYMIGGLLFMDTITLLICVLLVGSDKPCKT